MFTYRQGKAARLHAGARRSRSSILLGWRATSYALALDHGSTNFPCSKRANPHLPWDSAWASKWSRSLLRSIFTVARESLSTPKQLVCRPGSRWERGGRGPGSQKGREDSPRRLRGPPGLTARRCRETRLASGPAPTKAAPSPARRHPSGLGLAPSAERPRDSGAGLTHEEAEEIEADEQRPLAAAPPRVVVERRAAAVLALRDDRLVVLVVLHGAGCGASLLPREDARRQQPHTQTLGSPPGRGC